MKLYVPARWLVLVPIVGLYGIAASYHDPRAKAGAALLGL
jgi:hypothetical protein